MQHGLLEIHGAGALVLDSPHSGSCYPRDFDHCCPREALRGAEDFLVDELFAPATALGATLIAARLPRSYIDLNRAPEDIDPELLAPHERHGLAPSAKSVLGMGLVWRLLDGERPIYAGPVPRAEIERRIQEVWHPYHDALARAIDAARRRHGFVLHLNCHSMPSRSRLYPATLDHAMPFDFLLGDRDGSTAAPALTSYLADLLSLQGFRVGVNQVFKGVELVRRHGRPWQGRHSVQIEINRRLYMDEERQRPHAGFAGVQAVLTDLVRALLALPAVPTQAIDHQPQETS